MQDDRDLGLGPFVGVTVPVDDAVLNGYDDLSNLSFAFQCDANGHFADGAAGNGIAP